MFTKKKYYGIFLLTLFEMWFYLYHLPQLETLLFQRSARYTLSNEVHDLGFENPEAPGHLLLIGSWNKWIGLKPHGFLKMNIIIKIQNNKLNVFTCNIHIWIRLPPACCVYANRSNDTVSNVNFSLSSTKIHYPAYFWYQRVNHSIDT